MLFSLLASVALASLAFADPSDKSGKSQMTFQCTGVTLPDPVGGGGYGIFTDDLSFWPEGEDGPEIKPTACTELDAFCNNCLIEYDQLSSATNVTVCWNPPAGTSGCGMTFTYNGYDFDALAGQSYCGHTNGFVPFSSKLTAICYFDMDKDYVF